MNVNANFSLVIYLLLQDDVNTCFSSSKKFEKVDQINQQKPKENIFYYTNGDTVTFTCENLSHDNYTISWQEDLGNLKIPSPALYGNHYSLSVTLSTYDNGSIWYCSKDPTIIGIHFVTLESTAKNNYNHSFVDENLKITTQLLDPSEYRNEKTGEKKGTQCDCDYYVLENGRIVRKTTNESNLCIQFVAYPQDYFHIRRLSYDYEDQNFTNNVDFTITTTPLPITSDPEDDNSEKFWIVETSSAVLLVLIIIVISIITIFVCRRRKKNKPTAEALDATANEVQYVELQLQDTSSSNITRNDDPYAQVIGFMKKKNKNK